MDIADVFGNMRRSVLIAAVMFAATFEIVYPGCPATVNPIDMCMDSNITGTSVYIDTAAATGTDDLSGVLCTCTAQIQSAKLAIINVTGHDSQCGSKLTFRLNSDNTTVETGDNCKRKITRIEVLQKDELSVNLLKIGSPYETDYCINLKLELCLPGFYQCSGNGACIPEYQRCDGLPHCVNEDDEDCKVTETCTEGEFKCTSGECTSGAQCDGTMDCTDGSDESNCDANSTAEITTPAPVLKPLISVQCIRSTRFTTTTTPTTTTTSTTTTTPTTTTTTPTTTTTTPTTNSTIPTTTTTTTVPTTTTTTTPSTTAATTTTTTDTPATTPLQADSINTTTDTTSIRSASKVQEPQTVPPESESSPLKNPGVITAIVVGSLLVLLVSAIIIYTVYRKVNGSQSEDITKPNDMWIENKNEKELAPLNADL